MGWGPDFGTRPAGFTPGPLYHRGRLTQGRPNRHSTRPLRPLAGDLHEIFEAGADPETIGHVDADGVAFATIQGLADTVEDEDERIEELEACTEQLRARLRSVEDLLGLETATDPGNPGED